MGFLTLFPSTPPTAEIPQPTPTVDVSTVSKKTAQDVNPTPFMM
jgi:hypothetical protein